MKVRLLEDYKDFLTKDVIDHFKGANKEVKSKIIDNLINEYSNKSLKNISDAIYNDFSAFGIDPDSNKLIDFLDKINFSVSTNMNDQFNTLFSMYREGLVDISHDYLTNSSLFDRSPQEVEYTINAFESVMDKNVIKKYFTDTTEVSEDKFFNGNTIKPAGNKNTENDTNTIYGTVHDLENQFGKKGEKKGFSLKDVFNRFKMNMKEPEAIKEVSSWISRLATDTKTTSYYKPKDSNATYYATLFDKIMKSVLQNNKNNKNTKILNRDELDRIKQADHYNFLYADEKRAVPLTEANGESPEIYSPSGEKTDFTSLRRQYEEPPRKEGKIVYVDGLKKNRNGSVTKDIDNFVIFHDGNWQLYSKYADDMQREAKQAEADAARYSKFYNNLISNPTIDDESNKYAIVAGIMKNLDSMR